jgi:hypothetical protein
MAPGIYQSYDKQRTAAQLCLKQAINHAHLTQYEKMRLINPAALAPSAPDPSSCKSLLEAYLAV